MVTIAALYHFTRFQDPAALKPSLAALCCGLGVKGTLLLAPEGINGTIAGSRAAIDSVLAHIRALPGCADLTWKESASAADPFGRMKVRLKKEIVTMGQPDIDQRARVGHYVDPADWNDLIAADDVAVIDTRNDYEVGIIYLLQHLLRLPPEGKRYQFDRCSRPPRTNPCLSVQLHCRPLQDCRRLPRA